MKKFRKGLLCFSYVVSDQKKRELNSVMSFLIRIRNILLGFNHIVCSEKIECYLNSIMSCSRKSRNRLFGLNHVVFSTQVQYWIAIRAFWEDLERDFLFWTMLSFKRKLGTMLSFKRKLGTKLPNATFEKI